MYGFAENPRLLAERLPCAYFCHMTHACAHVHEHVQSHSPKERQALLAQAEAACEVRGQRMTVSRMRAYELILASDGPVKAYDLINNFQNGASTKPPTVYRALSFLEQAGLIHRIESMNAYVACDSQADRHAATFLLCDCCGKSVEVPLSVLPALESGAEQIGFKVHRVTLEAHGLCSKCQAGD